MTTLERSPWPDALRLPNSRLNEFQEEGISAAILAAEHCPQSPAAQCGQPGKKARKNELAPSGVYGGAKGQKTGFTGYAGWL